MRDKRKKMKLYKLTSIFVLTCITSNLKSAEPPNIELFGIYSEIDGIEQKYTTGKSFSDMDECDKTLISFNNLIMNLRFQGLSFEGKMKFVCTKILPTIQLNTE